MASEIIWKERIKAMKADIRRLKLEGLTEEQIKHWIISIINTYARVDDV